ncbi:MAG: hypothetical protein H6Q52_393 [Deltaproteobacteria bacterium]|nr:hypothetical protein [Deltaproteobacteria bacterium]
MMYCPRCRTKYVDPPDVCRYCEIPLVEQLPSITLTDYRESSAWHDDEEDPFEFPEDDDEKTQEFLILNGEVQDPEIRVKLLNRHFVLHVFWFAAWLMAGFFAAYFIIPDDLGEGTSLLVYSASLCAALVLGNLILKIRTKPDPSGTNDIST